MLNKVYEQQYLRSQGLDRWSKKRKREEKEKKRKENLEWMEKWMKQEKKTSKWNNTRQRAYYNYVEERKRLENAMTTIYDYNQTKYAFESEMEFQERKKKKQKQREKTIEEKLGTEEEFVEREMDLKYHSTIPLRMVKIIMDLLEKDENILINK